MCLKVNEDQTDYVVNQVGSSPMIEEEPKTFQITMVENGWIVTRFHWKEMRWVFATLGEMLAFLTREYNISTLPAMLDITLGMAEDAKVSPQLLVKDVKEMIDIKF